MGALLVALALGAAAGTGAIRAWRWLRRRGHQPACGTLEHPRSSTRPAAGSSSTGSATPWSRPLRARPAAARTGRRRGRLRLPAVGADLGVRPGHRDPHARQPDFTMLDDPRCSRGGASRSTPPGRPTTRARPATWSPPCPRGAPRPGLARRRDGPASLVRAAGWAARRRQRPVRDPAARRRRRDRAGAGQRRPRARRAPRRAPRPAWQREVDADRGDFLGLLGPGLRWPVAARSTTSSTRPGWRSGARATPSSRSTHAPARPCGPIGCPPAPTCTSSVSTATPSWCSGAAAPAARSPASTSAAGRCARSTLLRAARSTRPCARAGCWCGWARRSRPTTRQPAGRCGGAPTPTTRSCCPTASELDDAPLLDDGHVLLGTTTALRTLDLATGAFTSSTPLPTDGVSTTYWPYAVAVTDRLVAVATRLAPWCFAHVALGSGRLPSSRCRGRPRHPRHSTRELPKTPFARVDPDRLHLVLMLVLTFGTGIVDAVATSGWTASSPAT